MTHEDRPITYVYWPIRVVWMRESRVIFTWHPWPVAGSAIWPDGNFKVQGWTFHLGPLKILFGR